MMSDSSAQAGSSATASESPAPAAEPLLFSESLTPSPALWVLTGLFCSMWILVFVPISLPVGIAVAGVLFGILAFAWLRSTPTTTVSTGHLRSGVAHIGIHEIGEPEALTGEAARAARGPEFSAACYPVIRGWIPAVVRVPVTDPEDPTPFWLISSRRPEELAAAIRSAQAGEHRSDR